MHELVRRFSGPKRDAETTIAASSGIAHLRRRRARLGVSATQFDFRGIDGVQQNLLAARPDAVPVPTTAVTLLHTHSATSG